MVLTSNSIGMVFPYIIDKLPYTEWCSNFLGSDKCLGRMYVTKRKDYNKTHSIIFFELQCEICGYKRWSEPIKKFLENSQ